MIGIRLSREQVRYAHDRSGAACLGGVSRVRTLGTRRATVGIDNLVGQLGTMAYSLYQFGSVVPYAQARDTADADPTRGDGGRDFDRLAVDVKASFMRPGLSPTKYRLAVRPAERHAGSVYVLAIVERPPNGSVHDGVGVTLVGWWPDGGFQGPPEPSGTFEGAYTVRGDRLRKLPPWRWDGVEYFKPGAV